MVVSENGTELTSNAMLKWQEERKVEWHDIAPAPTLSAFAFKRLPGEGCRTVSWRVSTGNSGTNASMSTCLPTCVMMDNLPTHKLVAVRRAIRRTGAEHPFLPPYSPDFTPIEMAFSKIRTFLK